MMTLLAAFVAATLCPVASAPVDGPVTQVFAPIGRYAGHWGVDFGVPVGTTVGAPASGTVSFAGSIAGRLSVSIDHGRGLVSSVSYLSDVLVSRGEHVDRGDPLGLAGSPHGVPGVHLSLRIDGVYVDPAALFECRIGDIAEALWLVPDPG